jgi:hypothetical protein
LIRLVALLARLLTLLVCWAVLMGVPLLLFHGPLKDPAELKRFLGLFYTLLLATTTLVGRSWGGWGVVGVAGPFWVFFAVLGLSKLGDPSLSGLEKAMWAANFAAILPVSWLGWRFGKRLKSPARDEGRLI